MSEVIIRLKINRQIQEMFNACDKDREEMSRFYFNPQENELVVTNGHLLISLPGEEYVTEIFEGDLDTESIHPNNESFNAVAAKGFTLTIPKGQKKLGQNDEVLFDFVCLRSGGEFDEVLVDLQPFQGRHTSTLIRKGKDMGIPFSIELERGSGNFPHYRQIVDGALDSALKPMRRDGKTPLFAFNVAYADTITKCFGFGRLTFQLGPEDTSPIIVRPLADYEYQKEGMIEGMKAYALLMPLRR